MDLTKKKILVLGGCGFIGGHVIEALLRFPAHITIADRSARVKGAAPSDHADHVSTVEMDVTSPDIREFILSGGFDMILHFAGTASVPLSVEDPLQDFENTLQGTMRVLECLRIHSPDTAMIFTSSAAVYGNPTRLPMRESDPTNPISPYGVAKLSVERYCSVYSRLYGLATACIRPFSVYGPGQKKLLVYDLIRKLEADPDHLEMLGNGTETRDFVYVGDLARSVVSIAKKGLLQGEVYNVASGTPMSTLEVARAICGAMGIEPAISFTGTSRSGDPVNWCADVSRLRALDPTQGVTMMEGIERTLEWYRSTV